LTGYTLRVMMSFMIRVIIDGKEHKLDMKRIRVEILWRRLHINPETALVLRGGKFITEDEDLVEGDTCVIRRTIAER
jgi:sulfur carrier protein ThiS